MSVELLKLQLAFYTSAASVDSRILKYYSEEDKRTQAARATAEYTILKAWWESQGFNNKTVYDVWCSVVEPRGYLIGGTCHTSHDYKKIAPLINDFKETFLPDYDDDNIWWGEGEEPLEGYALEYVWVKFNVQHTVNDSGITRLGAHRRYLDLRIDTAVAGDFNPRREDGLPF